MLSIESENLQNFYKIRQLVGQLLMSNLLWISIDIELGADLQEDYELIDYIHNYMLDNITAYTLDKLATQENVFLETEDYCEIVEGNPDFAQDCLDEFINKGCPVCSYDAKLDKVIIKEKRENKKPAIVKEAKDVAKGTSGKLAVRDSEVR